MTYIGVDPWVAHSKGTLFIQNDATVSRALVLFLFIFITLRVGAVWFLITPVNTDRSSERLGVCAIRIAKSHLGAKKQVQIHFPIFITKYKKIYIYKCKWE